MKLEIISSLSIVILKFIVSVITIKKLDFNDSKKFMKQYFISMIIKNVILLFVALNLPNLLNMDSTIFLMYFGLFYFVFLVIELFLIKSISSKKIPTVNGLKI